MLVRIWNNWNSHILGGSVRRQPLWEEVRRLSVGDTHSLTRRLLRSAGPSRPTLCGPTDGGPPCSCPWNLPGMNTAVGCHLLPKGIFLNQGLNPCLLHHLHWQADSLPLEHLGSPPNTRITV